MTPTTKLFESIKRCVEALEGLEPHEQRANLDYLIDRFITQPERDKRRAALAKVEAWRKENAERTAKYFAEQKAKGERKAGILP